MSSPIHLRIVFGVICFVLATSLGSAQPPADTDNAAIPDAASANGGSDTSEKVADLQKQVSEATDLEPETATEINEMLTQTLGEIQRAEQLSSLAKADRTQTENVQTRVEELQARLEGSSKVEEFPPAASLAELESSLATRQAELQESKNRLAEQQAEQSRLVARRKEIAGLKASHAERKAEIEKQLASEGPANESKLLTAARRLLQKSKLESLSAELPAYQWEIAKYDSEQAVNLPDIRLKTARNDVTRIEKEVDSLVQRIDAMRKEKARSTAQKLRDFAATIDGLVLRAAAIRNAELAEENETVVRAIGDAVADEAKAQERFDELVALDKRTRERLVRVGFNDAIGLELRKQLTQLPDVRGIQRRSSLRHEKMRDVEVKRLEHEDELIASRRLAPTTLENEIAQRIRQDYVTTLESLTKNYDTYFLELSELDFTENEMIRATRKYRAFIDEHVLWIRSDHVFNLRDFSSSLSTLREVISPSSWWNLLRLLWEDVRNNSGLYFFSFLVLALLMPARLRGRTELTNLGEIASRPTCIQYSVTLRSAVLTLTIALAIPAVLFFVGWRLASPALGPFANAVGLGFMAVGTVHLLLDLVRQVCRPNGLALSHFEWSERSTMILSRVTRSLKFVMLPLVFLVIACHENEGFSTSNSLERLCFIVSSLLVGSALYRILHPRRGVMIDFFQKNPESWITSSFWFWFWVIAGFPITLAVIAFIGFYYTAFELSWRFWHTVWFAVCLVGLRAMMIRAFQIGHRKLHIQKAQERRTAINQETSVPGESMTFESEYASLRTINEQAFRVLHSGLLLTGVLALWLLWSGVMPAFRILDQWTLWETTKQVVVEVPLAEGGSKVSSETIVEAVTPIDFLAAVFIAFVTSTLVRNVPGLIEIVVLQRLPLDASFKFAITMMVRYLILVIGMIWVFSTIGFTWSKLQWLVAALTVGLGFGLQEIFGNLVSGLIILWERPIRIGDVVTLDGVTGTVSRIQMRATTIRDWDHKEYIVPNKDFVTGRLLNWTRSDRLNRLVIPVGVAYEADVDRALQLLLRVAAEHPNVVDDPAPFASFDDFGDSTLNLSLRCFLPDLSQRLGTKTELQLAINREFQAAGIEIAFPQQDLHVRTLPENVQLQPLSSSASDLSDASVEHTRFGHPPSGQLENQVLSTDEDSDLD